MVAKVISGKDIKGAINYNEQKVAEGKASLIQANGFLKEPRDLSFFVKLYRFVNLNEHNQRTKTNTLHISLNFDPSERFEEDMLNSIASRYMNKIGFSEQPYLVYQHFDAAHPHVHIVTSLIQENGKRIPVHNLGRNQSETARKEIEAEYNLIKASSKSLGIKEISPADVRKAYYGKSETRKTISDIVRYITQHYRFTTLPELNAVLGLYNVTAERGTPNSKMYAKGGLIYSIVDKEGKRIGIPFKASALHGKPILKELEKKFVFYELLRQPAKEKLRGQIKGTIALPDISSRESFANALKSKGVEVIFRTATTGEIFGITYVDTNQKVVFNGSSLGKEFAAKGVLEQINSKRDNSSTPATASNSAQTESPGFELSNVPALIINLLTADAYDPTSPEAALQLGKNKKKRKKRKL